MASNENHENTENQQQSQLKLLIAKGKEQGYLTYAEVNDFLPPDIIDPEQIDEIIRIINDMGIQVFEVAPDADHHIVVCGKDSFLISFSGNLDSSVVEIHIAHIQPHKFTQTQSHSQK